MIREKGGQKKMIGAGQKKKLIPQLSHWKDFTCSLKELQNTGVPSRLQVHFFCTHLNYFLKNVTILPR